MRKMLLQFVAPIALGYEVHEGVELIWLLIREANGSILQQLAIKARVRPATLDHVIESAEPETQHGCLERVEPGDVTELGHGIAVDETMGTQKPGAGGDFIGIGGDETGVAERVENLKRMSGEASNRAQGASATIAIARSHRLRRVLDDREPMPLRDS